MFTIRALCDAGIIAVWECPDAGLPIRYFYHSGQWLSDFNALPNDHARKNKLTAPIPVREKLASLINRYVDGTPRSRLMRPFGEGSAPVWKRMRPPNSAVVEFRTYDTRTFGFFSRRNVFVAHRVVLADVVKDDDSYEVHAAHTLKLMRKVSSAEIDGVNDVDHLVTD